MASVLEEVFSGSATILPQDSIGGIDIDCTIETSHADRLEVTEHPVEQGASITDHSFTKPSEITLRVGWSNASPAAAQGGSASASTSGGDVTGSDYVSGVYSQLLSLQESLQPFTIVTGLRTYDNMLLTLLNVTRDQKTSQALMVEAVCREVILVSTQSTTISPQSNQANPEDTAAVQQGGTRNVTTGSPASGGSADPSTWAPDYSVDDSAD